MSKAEITGCLLALWSALFVVWFAIVLHREEQAWLEENRCGSHEWQL